jgi:very-short-patch-repair endonuclease
MTGLLLLIVVLVVVAVLVLAVKAKAGADLGNGPWPFYAKKPLSVPEQVLYFRLVKAFPEHIVLAQVGLSRILGVKKGSNFQAWNNRINRMSADFVLCAKDSRIVAVVELDDASHRREARMEADAKKNKALADAGIRVLRWEAKSLPDEIALRVAVGAQQLVPADDPATPARRQSRG